MRRQRPRRPPLRDRLILHPFLCEAFGYRSLESMSRALDRVATGQPGGPGSGLAGALREGRDFPRHDPLPDERFDEYEANLAALSRRLRFAEGSGRRWKPHQLIALLLTEHYLREYFEDPERFLDRLNKETWRRRLQIRAREYRPGDLRTVAFQSATGSGKTLLMHAHILQYRHYLEQARKPLNHIILITPNEQMSEQHLRDLHASGLAARRFSSSAPANPFRPVEILEIHRLAERKGVKRVAVSDFGDDNLVLVDEGHLGASGKIWRERRIELARGGFAFEYSATFTQVAEKDDGLWQAYARSLLFDYGYRSFHADGYGKDFSISNLPQGMGDANSRIYLLGCLLTFYQQSRLFERHGKDWRDFQIEKPLFVFLGKTVKGSSGVDREARSDVIRILDFLGWVLAEGPTVRSLLARLLSGNSGLIHPERGGDYFEGRFPALAHERDLYATLCETLFHGRGALRVIHLASGTGELHLRTGDNLPFGVVNVGDAAGLYRLLAERENPNLRVERDPGIVRPLFSSVDSPDSTVNLVIGARRFIAGWNSWRVSTMGLMHVGVGEGPEIIQMFGRGVRLKGWKTSLKRHGKTSAEAPPASKALTELETLHVFGLRANYMETFRKILQGEGVNVEPMLLPTTWNFGRKTGLKMIRLRKEEDFERSAERAVLPGPDEEGRPFVEMDRYSRLQSLSAAAGPDAESPAGEPAPGADPNQVRLSPRYTGFFDRSRIRETLLARKRSRDWHNLVIETETVDALLDSNDWYRLRIPPEQLVAGGFDRFRRLEDLATDLLTDYADRFWRQRRRAFEHHSYRVEPLDETDPNHIREYQLWADGRDEKLVHEVREFVRGRGSIPNLGMLNVNIHAYRPLLWVGQDCRVRVSPVPLDLSEKGLVEELATLSRRPERLRGRDLYLIRNLTRGYGVSFFDDFAYYPDFIVWLKDASSQHLVFLDPKGLGHYGARARRKVELHARIKDIEAAVRESDPEIRLHACVLSVTPPDQIDDGRLTRQQWEEKGVYFLHEPDGVERAIQKVLDTA